MKLQFQPESRDRYRWLALFVGMVLISTGALGYTWSLLVEPMIVLRGATEAGMATIYSVQTVLCAVFTVLGGKLIEKIGSAKTIFTTFVALLIGDLLCGLSDGTVMFAIGQCVFIAWQQSVIYVAVMSTAEQMFPDYRGLAVSLTACGLAVGGMILAPAVQFLIDVIGVGPMFVVQGIAVAVLGCIMLIFFPDYPKDYKPAYIKKNETGSEREGTKSRVIANPKFVQKNWKGMLKDPAFWIMFFIPLCASSGYMLLSYQLAYIAEDILGIDAMTASFLISGVSLMGIISFVVGPIGDRIGRPQMMLILLIVGFFAMLGLSFCEGKGIVWFAACAFIYCFALGGFAGLHPALVGDYFGSEHYGFNYSLNYTSILLAAAISPWLAVGGADAGYGPMFAACTIAVALAAILAVILIKYRGNNIEFIRIKKNETEEDAVKRLKL